MPATRNSPMNPDPQSSVATRLLDDLLSAHPELARQAHDLLAPIAAARDELRSKLIDTGQIVTLHPDPQPVTTAAVDGAMVKQLLYACDLLVVVAAAAGGMHTSGEDLPHSYWTQVVPHTPDNDILIAVAMATRELLLLNDLTHQLRILDGSHTSPIITLARGINAHGETQDRVAELIDDEVLQAVYNLGAPGYRSTPGEIVALPKSDSSRYFTDLYESRFEVHFASGDRYLAAQLLEPGEMFFPRTAVEHQDPPPQAIPTDAEGPARDVAKDLAKAVGPVKELANSDRLVVTYLKPASADTVVKAEIQLDQPLGPADDGDTPALLQARKVARTLSDETPGPFLQEPFPQYVVDQLVKNISVGTEALQQSMVTTLNNNPASAAVVPYLARAYRTQ